MILKKPKKWVWNDKKKKWFLKVLNTHLVFKIFDEILVNARDATVTNKQCDSIDVNCNMEDGSITVKNNGSIPVEEHPKHKVMVLSMIFGEMLSGSNFDDNEKELLGEMVMELN